MFVTAPNIFFISLPYATKEIHIGRLGGSFIPADILKQYYITFKNQNSILISGLDCYGSEVYLKAKSQNLSPEEYVYLVNIKFKKILDYLGIQLYTDFTTTSLKHRSFVQNHIKNLLSRNRLVIQEKEKNYCMYCDIFLADRFLIDQNNRPYEKLIENNIKPLLPYKCKLCDQKSCSKSIKVLVLNYVPDLSSKYHNTKKMLNLMETEKEISRNKSLWGLPNSKLIERILGEPSSCYVWVEALLSYLEQFLELNTPTSNIFYFYAKDNRYYHEIVFPQLLQDEKINPKFDEVTSFCRNYYLFSKEKMSSSTGNCLDPLLLGIPGDMLRYATSKLDTLSSDSEISEEKIKELAQSYFKEYVNMVKRIDGICKNNRYVGSPSFDIDPRYHQCMLKNDLSKSLDYVHLYYKKINRKIDMELNSKTIEKNIPEFYALILNLFLYLQPFTPKISKQIIDLIHSQKPFFYDISTFKIY